MRNQLSIRRRIANKNTYDSFQKATPENYGALPSLPTDERDRIGT